MSNPAIIDLPERVRDRDIFRDHQGRTFVTLGYIQPIVRVLSYLKYIPDENGKWQAQGTRYRRFFWGSVDSTVEGMPLVPEDYITFDTHFQTDLVEPPRTAIKDYFSPEQRLKEILTDPQDEMEELVQRAAKALHDELRIPLENLGIAGSILWKAHNPEFSDINMNIYGFKESWVLQKNYSNLENKEAQTRLRDLPEWNRAIDRIRARISILDSDSLQTLFTRRNALCIGDRCIGITPILRPNEIPIEHGSETYTTIKEDPVKITTTVESADYGIFHPAIYTIASALLDNISISRIMIYDGAFGGLFKTDDKIEVSGTLQKVVRTSSGEEFHQLMIGTKSGSGKEYVRLLS
jgi:predicted nucleotidyltransferase